MVTYIKVEDEVLIFAEHGHIEPVKEAFIGDDFTFWLVMKCLDLSYIKIFLKKLLLFNLNE